jgi:hypothetical protein
VSFLLALSLSPSLGARLTLASFDNDQRALLPLPLFFLLNRDDIFILLSLTLVVILRRSKLLLGYGFPRPDKRNYFLFDLLRPRRPSSLPRNKRRRRRGSKRLVRVRAEVEERLGTP